MKCSKNIAIKGQCKITVQKGAIRIYGALLKAGPKQYSVSASLAASFPVIECALARGKSRDVFIATPENKSIENDYTTIVYIENNLSGLENIPALYAESASLKNLWGGLTRDHRTFSPIFSTQLSTQMTLIPPEWTDAMNSIAEKLSKHSVVLVAGAKNSGKSMFTKYLSNYMLSRFGKESVYYLDCDPKHSEYSPIGLVSLHKMVYNFTVPFGQFTEKTCIKAHSIGDVNPKKAFLHYIQAIEDLVNEYKKVDSSKKFTTLVINTPGWSKGLGMQLLEHIYTYAEPSTFVYLGPDCDPESFQDFERTFKPYIERERQPSLVVLDTPLRFIKGSLPGRGADKIGSRDLQDLQLLGYFHYVHQFGLFNFKQKITKFRPYAIPYRKYGQSTLESFGIEAFGIMFAEGIVSDDIELCLRGSVVSIVAVSSSVKLEITQDTVEQLPWMGTKGIDAITPFNSRCVGLGLIQSFNMSTSQVKLITPIDCANVLGSVKKNNEKLIFVRGSIQYPLVDLLKTENPSDQAYIVRNASTKQIVKTSTYVPFVTAEDPEGIESKIQALQASMK
jgi:polynucleotide 5'-hydroxyl-kinase GRC3/NOL9